MVRYFFASLALSVIILASGCVTSLPTINYRLTVVIDTPQGRRTGSGVMELTSNISPEFPGPEAGGRRFMVHGEAVPVRLADGNYIFVVRKWQKGQDEALAMLQASFADSLTPIPPHSYGDKYEDAVTRQIKELARIRGSRAIPPDYYPIVAYFPEITNPESIMATDAGRVDKIIPGARLVSMSVEITDDAVTRKITEILPWFDIYKGGYFDPYAKRNAGEELPSERRLGKSHFYTS